MKNIVLLGPPGCGKGTQAGVIVDKLKYVKVSTGDLLRELAKEDSELGRKTNKILMSGVLISDEEVNRIIENFCNQNITADGIIYDGYPRNVLQAQSLEQFLNSHSLAIDLVFYFDLSETTLIKRITGRYACNHCGAIYNEFYSSTIKPGECDNCGSSSFSKRTDDLVATLVERLNVYKKSTSPLLEYYKNKIIKIDAEKSVKEVSNSLLSYLR